MARNETEIAAPPDVVWGMLADPRPYGAFVVGTKHVRRFEPAWPEVGSAFHHTLGVGPFILRDATWVVEVVPGVRLRLHAGMRPLAVSEVVFEIEPRGVNSTQFVIHEHSIRGPLAALWNPLFDALFWLRNQELVRRFRRLAERRAATVGPARDAREVAPSLAGASRAGR